MNTLNKNIENAFKYANSQTNSETNLLSNRYGVFKYWKNKETIEWNDLCKFANMKFSHLQTPKFGLCMLVYFLENNLYQSEHKEKLLCDLPYLKRCVQNFKANYKTLLQDNYDEMHFIDYADGIRHKGLTVITLFNCNNFYGALYIEYLAEKDKTISNDNRGLNYDFMRSTEEFTINSLGDIDSKLFWHQINFFKHFYETDKKKKERALKNVCRFYRWLLTKHSEHDFFVNSTNLTYELIFNNIFFKYVNSNAYFTTLTNSEDLGDKSNIVFILRNFQNKSTRLVKNTHFVLNTEALTTSYYRKILNKYIQTSTIPSLFLKNGQTQYIIDVLHLIEQTKAYKGYPDPDSTKLCTCEAIMIRDYFKVSNPDLALSSLNTKIGSIRRFFQWAQRYNYLTFDPTFFDYLSQYEEPNQFRGNAIPDDDIKKLSDTFLKLCKEDQTYKLYYAIFLILIETEFRISQICNLTVSSIQPTLKNDQFLLYSNTKTSNGKKTTQPICMSTKKILESVINDTEQLRNNVLQDSYKNHIFLYQTHVGNVIKGVDRHKFLTVFQTVCNKAGTKLYNTRHLRDTHMTKAFEFIMRNGKSDLEMGVLSRHKRIDTTKSHYIEVELTKMLESTYKVTLGNRDITQRSHILDTLPNNLNENETLVENGCGHCIAKTCNMIGSLPCLICKDFVTTINRKPYFIKMISYFDEVLESSTIRHEIEDLTLMKTLYINWLREICLKEEEDYANTNNN